MELYGIEVEIKNKPPLEEDFLPIMVWNEAYLSQAHETFIIAITADDDNCVVHRTHIRDTPMSKEADLFYVTRLVKSLLWIHGGYKISITGNFNLFGDLKHEFTESGLYDFDIQYMEKAYQRKFIMEFLATPPKRCETPRFLSRHLNGNRIGLCLGVDQRKVVAITNGKVTYSEESLWNPQEESDPAFHYQAILDSLMSAAKKIPRIDAIGISSTGIFRENYTCASSLFAAVEDDDFEEHIRDIYVKLGQAMNCEQTMVLNNGDVVALAGVMNLETNNILGIALDHDLSIGYVDPKGNIKGWLNAFLFAPIDVNPEASKSQWSDDIGLGNNYFSQMAALRLAEVVGLRFEYGDSHHEKIKKLQVRAETGDSKARLIFTTMGHFLGHSIAYFHSLYQFDYVILQGKLTSGAGGDMLFNAAQKILAEEYPQVATIIAISLPGDDAKKIDPTVAAATIPEC